MFFLFFCDYISANLVLRVKIRISIDFCKFYFKKINDKLIKITKRVKCTCKIIINFFLTFMAITFKHYATKNKLSDNILYHGRIKPKKIPNLTFKCNFFVFYNRIFKRFYNWNLLFRIPNCNKNNWNYYNYAFLIGYLSVHKCICLSYFKSINIRVLLIAQL